MAVEALIDRAAALPAANTRTGELDGRRYVFTAPSVSTSFYNPLDGAPVGAERFGWAALAPLI